ncbi:MAG: hypothetical protein Q9220_001022 [cf. Caloplaca sp. 1 TL-2023]
MTSISQPVLPPQPSNSAAQTVAQAQTSSASLGGRTPPQAAGTAPPPARSYASATKKQSSPTSATATSDPTAAPGVPASLQHGKTDSFSAVNGKTTITPAVPALGGAPIIANGNTTANSNSTSSPVEHGRKASITITPAGNSGYLPNGSQAGAKPAGGNGIKWGDLNADGSPALANAVPQMSQSSNALAVNPPQNPRVTSPAASPSPIPQPPASGGRVPSSFQGQSNGMSFGSMPASDDPTVGPSALALVVQQLKSVKRQLRPNAPQSNFGPGSQATHLRRESSQSAHSDLGNPGMGLSANRGGYPPQGGRGRAYNGQYPPQQQQQQQMGYGQGQNFRAPSQPRGATNASSPYPSRQSLAAPYPNSPHQAARSPALAHSQPVHQPQPGQIPISNPPYLSYQGYAQQMGPSQVKPHSSLSLSHQPSLLSQRDAQFSSSDTPMAVQPLDLSPGSGHFEQYLTGLKQNQHMMSQYYDPNYAAAQYHPYNMYGVPPQFMQNMPPSSPRPHQQIPQGMQQQYAPGQYGPSPQPPSMSRTSSAISISAERPPSNMGKSQTPMPSTSISNTPMSSRPTNSPAPKATSSFKIPEKKRAGIIIRDPNSGAVKSFDKTSTSPAPPTPSPAATSSTPTPPPRSTSGADIAHTRSESKSVKTNEEKRNDMRDAIARKLEEDKAEEQRKKEGEEAKAVAEKKEAEARLAKEKAEAEARELAAAKAQMEAEEKALKEKAEAAEAEKAAEKIKADEELARKKREEDEEIDRIEAEMERKERENEERYQRKKQAEKEEAARREAEAARNLDEEMRRAEREAEEAEEARLKKLADGEGDASQKESRDLFAALKKDGAATPSSESPTVAETPVESGAQTPASEASMAPPRGAASKQKPAALKLETTKAVEPPQPSAQLLSLRSARRLTSLNDVSYPPAIASPNPSLNTTAPMGKFRYDKNFLVQFQSVFVEKPSEDWSNKIKETLGETSEPASARTGSARPGGSMGARVPSKTGAGMPPMGGMGSMGGMGGGMGSFNARPPQPPGNNSEQRFKASTQQLAGAQRGMQNPLAPYMAGRPGGFPMGGAPKMERIPSTTSMGAHPHSPRGNPSQRGSAGRASKSGRTRENDKDAKSMPLTAGTTLKPIETTEKGWKPTSVGASAFGMAGPAPGGDGHMAPDIVQRKVKSNLNKMTPNNFDKISDQILAIAAQSKDETDGRTLRQVIQLTFEKATDEAHWAEMYAQFCKRMLESMSPEVKDESILDRKKGEVVAGGALFRKYLLTRCQTEFERGWKVNLPEKPEGESEEAVMLSDEYYTAAAAKRRGLGLVRFIGELYKLSMLTERIMHECVKKLVDYEGMPDEAEVESLTSLLKTIGANLDSSDKGHQLMDIYFSRIQVMIDTPGLASRLRFMLMDIGDMRKKNWPASKAGALKAPATLEQVRAEAVEAERQKELQRQADAGARRGGGNVGGRPAMGRGDARQFSGGGQFGMPPPDYRGNTVGMDELRRLGRGGSRQPSQAGGTVLGPPSNFGPRGSNTRKTLGPSGIGKAGEDSGASSRTGTPPAQKDKKEKDEAAAAKHTNAFSALAGLDNAGEPADPASPPSATSSPPTTKLNLAQRQRSKSPLGKKDDDKPEGESS